MVTDLELMEIQADVLFKKDNLGRITEINEPICKSAPLFFLGRTKVDNVLRFNESFPETIINEVTQIVNQNPTNVDIGKIVIILNKVKAISKIWIGPAYVFPENFNMISDAIKITNANKRLLQSGFPNLLKQFEWRQPLFAVIEDGTAVSVCCSARISKKAAEASVETLEAYQGKGYGRECVIAWAREVQKKGRHSLYSTAWDNFPSEAIAKKLNLYKYGIDFHIS
ncbi:GNAT family N-acetyltransferase [Neobacillus sp. NPDC093182]|uniref:GNAT family N-acetyltransferase n=1 Tax=Neobacillus sp. NPDC093182 TaxID=3364297 RepID=UPI00380B11D9